MGLKGKLIDQVQSVGVFLSYWNMRDFDTSKVYLFLSYLEHEGF